jgi:hypothetical protein
MKASLKKNLNNAEYFRLPQMYTDSTFQEMQRAVSEKYAQYMAGPFPESEHQKPYENDGDYQATENDYVPWQYPPWNWPPWITPKWEWPQGDDITPNCLALWNKLFPGWKTGARLVKPRSSEWGALQQLDHAGCLKYIPRYCCPNVWEVEKGAVPNKNKRASGEASILGPSEVEAGQTVEYEYIHAQGGCTYSWDAVKGNITSGTYTAPNVLVDTEDTISVHPFMGDDSAATCAERKIKIKVAGCGTAVPSPTSLQMPVSTTQQLTVANAVVGAVYSWVITAGGGSFSNETPTTIDYTSPATNVNCANNTTIELRRGASVCGTVRIAIHAGGDTEPALYVPQGPYCGSSFNWYSLQDTKSYGCDGAYKAIQVNTCGSCYGQSCTHPTPDCVSVLDVCTNCGNYGGVPIACTGTTDVRSAARKTAGCCPIQLM